MTKPDLLADIEPPETPRDRLDRMIACVAREIGYRETVYARWIDAGKLKSERAKAELDAMREVASFLGACVVRRIDGDLFQRLAKPVPRAQDIEDLWFALRAEAGLGTDALKRYFDAAPQHVKRIIAGQPATWAEIKDAAARAKLPVTAAG